MDANLSQVVKSDIQFAIIYMLARKLTNKSDITFIDLNSIDLTQITEGLLTNCKQQVYNKYVELGGNSTIAKSSRFTDAIDEMINNTVNDLVENI